MNVSDGKVETTVDEQAAGDEVILSEDVLAQEAEACLAAHHNDKHSPDEINLTDEPPQNDTRPIQFESKNEKNNNIGASSNKKDTNVIEPQSKVNETVSPSTHPPVSHEQDGSTRRDSVDNIPQRVDNDDTGPVDINNNEGVIQSGYSSDAIIVPDTIPPATSAASPSKPRPRFFIRKKKKNIDEELREAVEKAKQKVRDAEQIRREHKISLEKLKKDYTKLRTTLSRICASQQQAIYQDAAALH
eukprot:GHVR01077578.1.p1 GENE.GHVR01077578.1~~GHVR01077578.1.p1  ORF type:complete len:245 (+),score=69.47 GHVR01077578.1:124-858(+)